MEGTGAVLIGRVSEQLGPNSAHDEGAGGLIFRRWRVEVVELLKGSVSGNSVLVRINTHLLGTPTPPTGLRAGLSTGAPSMRVGEEVLLFLTRDLPVSRPVSYPSLGIDEFMLAGPNSGKWVFEEGQLRCDDPTYHEKAQAKLSAQGTLALLREQAQED